MTEAEFVAQYSGHVEWGIAVATYWGDVTASVRIDRMQPDWRSAVWTRLATEIDRVRAASGSGATPTQGA